MSNVQLPSPQAGHSLNAANANGNGVAFAAPPGVCDYAVQVVETGTITGNTTQLQGTLDWAHWFTIATWTHGTQTNGDIVFAVDKPVSGLRAVLTNYAGTGTVDAWVSAAGGDSTPA